MKIIECIQCNIEFKFTVSEQTYHKMMGFDDPKRCPYCRKHKTKLKMSDPRISRNRKEYIQQKYDQYIEV